MASSLRAAPDLVRFRRNRDGTNKTGEAGEPGVVVRAVVLAGGKGTRLAPYTTILPKPLLPVGDLPILELLLRQLRRAEIRSVTLAVGYLAAILRAFFGDGERLGLELDYSYEDEPLGTAGPLRLVSGLNAPFLVMNGDLLTDLDFRSLLAAHRERDAVATIGTCRRDVPIDLGVIETNAQGEITAYVEKPVLSYRASMGIYVFQPEVLRHIPKSNRFDLPELIQAMMSAGERIQVYEHSGYWLDIGRPDDFEKAQADFPAMRARLLGGETPGVEIRE